ncbi:interleukin-12 subunit beta [Genypterus blacodes]|uniref:interleukin-12 subunit beta n=1 Tax=Genypterus blacodes TaxID=154954 RepID=UPI003F75C355
MLALLLMGLYMAPCCQSSESHQEIIETLMDHVLVLRVPHDLPTTIDVPLICGEAHHNQEVFWKKNGVEPSPALQGNNITVPVLEMDGGNYTCHLRSTGQYLNHTLVLVQLYPDNHTVILEKKSHEEGHIHCWALNYEGSFHCSWTRTHYRSNAAVVLVKAERKSENISCELNTDGSRIDCQDADCQYKEEQHRISITVYLRSYWRLEAYTREFFLRDIVRPEQLPSLREAEGGVFSWNYPDSWEKPCTFFRLLFQVKIVHHRDSCDAIDHIRLDTTEATTYEVNIKTKKYVFCVRAQDKFTNGPWSNWSQYVVNKHRASR